MSVPYWLPPCSMKRATLVHTTHVSRSSKPKRYSLWFILFSIEGSRTDPTSSCVDRRSRSRTSAPLIYRRRAKTEYCKRRLGSRDKARGLRNRRGSGVSSSVCVEAKPILSIAKTAVVYLARIGQRVGGYQEHDSRASGADSNNFSTEEVLVHYLRYV
jgi:hypothetical protein